MRRVSLLALAMSTAMFAHARPVIIEESARIPTPDPAFEYFARHVAVDGNHALLLGEHFDRSGDVIVNRRRAAFWFERNAAGTWVFRRKLADTTRTDDRVTPALALRGGIAGFIGNNLRVFEYNGTDYVAAPVSGTVNGPNLQIAGASIFGSDTSNCRWDISNFTKVSGTWTVTRTIPGAFFGCRDSMPGSGFSFEDPAVTGFGAVVWPYTDQTTVPTIALSHGERIPGSSYGTDVVAQSQYVWIASDRRSGVATLAAGAEGYVGDRRYMPAGTHMSQMTRTVRVALPYVLQNTLSHDRNAYVVNVFAHEGTPHPRHVAVLVGRNGASLGTRMDVSGRRVIVSGNNGYNGDNAAHVFELPESFAAEPAPLQDSFQTSNAAGWTPLPGSQFEIAQVWRTRKYRQSNTAGHAGAVLNGSDRALQAVQADVTRRTSAASDAWFGIASRYTDAGNHYYVSLRANNRIELRKVTNGVETTLASAAMTVTTGRPYRVQLVSSLALQQVFVDGRKVLQAFDRTHTSGLAAIRMYRSAADYDNVVVTRGEHETAYATSFSSADLDFDRAWYYRGDWNVGGFRAGQMSQRSLDGMAYTQVGMGLSQFRDQVVQARVTLDAFGPTTGAERYFGLTARHTGYDFYALVVLSSNQMQLRKVYRPYSGRPGDIRVLATATFTVPTVAREYRLEVIGNVLRAFVDGNPMLEATDSEFTGGTTGLITENTQASYDDFLSYQP
jgi:hypothetical protein